MTKDELEVHQTRQEQKKQKVLDLEGGIREQSVMASEVLKRAKATRIFVNRKHLKKSEQERFAMGESLRAKKEAKVKRSIENEMRHHRSKNPREEESGLAKILNKIKHFFFH
jgi:hypothetical protein